MANSTEYDVIINIITGHLEKATKELRSMGGAIDGVNKAHKAATKSGKEHNDIINGGVASANNGTRGFAKLKDAIDGSNGIVAAYATLATNAFAVSAAFNQLRSAAQVETVLKGLEVQGVRTGRTLTNLSKDIQNITQYSVSAADAMQATAQASAAGINADQFKQLAQVAQNSALALGRSVPDALDRLVKGTTKLEPELLDELGIMVKLDEASNKYADSIGRPVASLTRLQKSQAFLNAVISEGEAKFGGLEKSMKPNVYDRLAATFSNLVTSILNTINSAPLLSDIIGALADNTGLLAAVILRFVSSISKQLIPGLYNMANASAEAANKSAQLNIQKQKEIQTNLDLAKSVHAVMVAEQARAVSVSAKAPPKVKKFFEVAQDPTTTQEQLQKAKQDAERSAKISSGIAKSKMISDVEGTKTLTEAELKHNAALQSVIDQNNKYVESMERVISAHSTLAKEELAAAAAAERAALQSGSLAAKEKANLARAAAIRAGGDLSIGGVIKSTKESSAAAAEAAALSGAAKSATEGTGVIAKFTRTMGMAQEASAGFRGALFGVGTAIRTVASGILRVIPVIGEWFMIAELAWEIGKKLWELINPKSEADLKLEKVKSDLEEITKRSQETAQVISTIFADPSANAAKQAQALIALSNTINENIDKYKELKKAKQEAEATSSSSTGAITIPQKVKNELAKSVEDTSSEAYKRLDALAGQGYTPLSNAIAEATYKSQEWADAQGDAEKQEVILDKALSMVQKRYGTVGDSIQNLQSSYNDLDKATSEFIQSATVKTPYDNLNTALTNTVSSMYKLTAEYERGAISSEDFYKQLTTISNKALGNVNQDTQALALQIRNLVAQRNTAEAGSQDTTKNSQERGALAKQAYELEQKIVGLRGEYNQKLFAGLEKAQQENAERQKNFILTQGQIKLEEARYSKVQGVLGATVAAKKLEFEHQDKLLGLQKKQLNGEITHLENLNFQNKQQITNIENQIKGLSVQEAELDIANDKYSVLESIWKLTSGLITAQQADDEKAKRAEETEKRRRDLAAQNADLQAALLQAKSQESELGNAILSKKQEIAVLDAASLTTAERVAEYLQIQKDTYSKLDAQRLSQGQKIFDLENKIREARQVGDGSKFLSVLKNQTAEYNKQLENIKAQTQAENDQYNADITRIQAASNISETVKNQQIEALRLTHEFKLQELDIDRMIAETTRTISLYEQAKIDVYKEGIEIQRDSLNILQKNIDANKSIISQEQEIATLRARIQAKKLGQTLSPEAEQAIAYQAAQREYRLALQTHELKIQAIDMEYDLLEAQKMATVAELKMRKMALEAFYRAQPGGITTEQQTALQQIDSAANNYASKTYEAARVLAKAQEDNNLTILKLKAEEAGIFNIGGNNPVAAAASAMQQAMTAMQSIQEGNKPTKPFDGLSQAVSVIRPDLNSLQKTMDEKVGAFSKELSTINLKIPDLTSAITTLNINFNELIKYLKSIGEVAPGQQVLQSGSVSTGLSRSQSPEQMIQSLASYVESNYSNATIGGLKGHGGRTTTPTTGHMKGSLHYSDRAFDVNASGNEKATLDKMAVDLSSKGVEVLWNGWIYHAGKAVKHIKAGQDQHTDHLHAEMDAASYAAVKKALGTTTGGVVSGARRAATETPKSNEIVVGDSPKRESSPIPPLAISNLEEADGLLTHMSMIELPPLFLQLPTIIPTTLQNMESFGQKMSQLAVGMSIALAPFIAQLKTLGPDGELAAAIGEGMISIMDSVGKNSEAMAAHLAIAQESTKGSKEQFQAYALAASDALNTVGALVSAVTAISAASAKAKVANIDKEIAAEQKRDGKSKESLDKIDAMEKKKDAINRKAFNTNKKLMMAQAVISTASAIAQTLGKGGWWAVPLAIAVGAMGAAQLAIIAGTQYESTYSPKSVETPTTLSIGKRSDTVDLAKGPNANAGGEVNYLRGSQGMGTNASDFRTVGSAYGGELTRGYGNRGFVVGEKGPEIISPETPINVTPADKINSGNPINANISIHAIDSQGVQDVLVSQKGNIIKMLRDAANASGQRFMENVNVNVYTRPSIGKL